jgi:hypothetical protein
MVLEAALFSFTSRKRFSGPPPAWQFLAAKPNIPQKQQLSQNREVKSERFNMVDILDIIIVSVNFGQGTQVWTCQ